MLLTICECSPSKSWDSPILLENNPLYGMIHSLSINKYLMTYKIISGHKVLRKSLHYKIHMKNF